MASFKDKLRNALSISSEEADMLLGSNTTTSPYSASGNNAASPSQDSDNPLTFSDLSAFVPPDSPAAEEFVKGLTKVKEKWLSGGNKNEWEKVKELVRQWKVLVDTSCRIVRVKSYAEMVDKAYNTPLALPVDRLRYSDPKKAGELPSSNEPPLNFGRGMPNPQIMIESAVSEAIHDVVEGKKDTLALLEVEILRRGGWLYGIGEKSLFVYFPLTTERILQKLSSSKEPYGIETSGFAQTTISGGVSTWS